MSKSPASSLFVAALFGFVRGSQSAAAERGTNVVPRIVQCRRFLSPPHSGVRAERRQSPGVVPMRCVKARLKAAND
jgi:hypothetical protein